MFKKFFAAAALCAAGTFGMAAESEEVLSFSFDENIQADNSANGCSVVGHIGATENNGGFSGEALDIKPGISVGHSGMEMQFRALTVKPAAHHNPEKGAIEFYFSTVLDEAGKKKVEAMPGAPFSWLFNICRYDNFGQEQCALNIRYGYIFQKGKRGKQWRLLFLETRKRENRHYKTTYDWTQCVEENVYAVETGSWKPGEWHHIVFSWEGKNRKFYVDGKLLQEVKESKVYPMIADPSSMVICGRAPFQHHQPLVHCRMDELKIYNAPIVPKAKEAAK